MGDDSDGVFADRGVADCHVADCSVTDRQGRSGLPVADVDAGIWARVCGELAQRRQRSVAHRSVRDLHVVPALRRYGRCAGGGPARDGEQLGSARCPASLLRRSDGSPRVARLPVSSQGAETRRPDAADVGGDGADRLRCSCLGSLRRCTAHLRVGDALGSSVLASGGVGLWGLRHGDVAPIRRWQPFVDAAAWRVRPHSSARRGRSGGGCRHVRVLSDLAGSGRRRIGHFGQHSVEPELWSGHR
mmetsp:Transcript_87054/g.251422  ORF Transcript_87054/g.251422 Transcript_87054/m.251422 type:complete len:245 (+) Transcript_87054:508-1242(+)